MKGLYFALILLPIFSFCQTTNDFVDQYSQVSLQITERNGTRNLYVASGFVMHVKGQRYLITNNHVVGEEYAEQDYLHRFKKNIPRDSIPDNLLVRCYSSTYGQYSNSIVRIRNRAKKFNGIKFYEDEKDTTTILDVVAIPLMRAELDGQFKWVDSSNLNNLLLLYPGMELFVIGYPSDSGSVLPLPIWKRGTIATEPNLIEVGDSHFFIDATTRGGMSGSPVVFRGNIAIGKTGGMLAFGGGIPTFVIGIYSAQSYSLELGVVTKLDKIYLKLRDLNP